MEIDLVETDEEYVLQRAKNAWKTDPLSAKAWMITAKTLYPDNFCVQFEAYKIEKSSGHVKEAAKCFSDLIGKFQQQPEFWKEINSVTAALRAENDSEDSEKVFLCEMFKHISLDVQHKLLLLTADHCEDTQEHCKLLLLLLQRFPSAIPTHGPGLVETLLSAEKHSLSTNQPINCYRKLLVCDLLPLLNSQVNISMDLSPKLIYKLLHKAIEYHLCILKENVANNKDGVSSESWNHLFCVMEFVGKQLSWESYLINFTNNWCKESYWQKLLTFCHTPTINWEDPNTIKQLIYCLTIFLLYCLHQYIQSITFENYPSFVLVEAFTDVSLPNPQTQDPKNKRKKTDIDNSLPYLTTEKNVTKNITGNFMMAVNCWDLLHSAEHISREFLKLTSVLSLDTWITNFYIDYLVYKGNYEEASKCLETDTRSPLINTVIKASLYYVVQDYRSCFELISDIVTMLPTNLGEISNQLIIGGTQRHLHFLNISKHSVLQYCAKILLRSIKNTGYKHELAIGHSLVLMQLDWPQEEDMLPPLIEMINQNHSFNYFLFQNYIIQVDILEELAYLWGGGQVTLDIVPNVAARRMGTRGADKGMKEVIKQAIRRQIARCNESIFELIQNFLVQERHHISPSLS